MLDLSSWRRVRCWKGRRPRAFGPSPGRLQAQLSVRSARRHHAVGVIEVEAEYKATVGHHIPPELAQSGCSPAAALIERPVGRRSRLRGRRLPG